LAVEPRCRLLAAASFDHPFGAAQGVTIRQARGQRFHSFDIAPPSDIVHAIGRRFLAPRWLKAAILQMRDNAMSAATALVLKLLEIVTNSRGGFYVIAAHGGACD